MRRRRRGAATMAACITALSAIAASPPEPPPVERVEVEADGPPEEDPAAFATVVQAEEAARRGASLADLLRRVPGARVRDYGGLGGYATSSTTGFFARPLVSAGGLLGPAVLGGLLIVAGSRTERLAKGVLGALAVAVLLSVLIWVRNLFGMVMTGVVGVALIALAIKGNAFLKLVGTNKGPRSKLQTFPMSRPAKTVLTSAWTGGTGREKKFHPDSKW